MNMEAKNGKAAQRQHKQHQQPELSQAKGKSDQTDASSRQHAPSSLIAAKISGKSINFNASAPRLTQYDPKAGDGMP